MSTAPVTYPLDDLAATADKARVSRNDLAQAIVVARDVNGFTWRVIAQAVGMTEHGAAKLYRRTIAGQGDDED